MLFLASPVHYLFMTLLGILSLVLLMIFVVLLYSFYQYRQTATMVKWTGIINQKILETIAYDKDEIPSNEEFTAFSNNGLFRNLFLSKLVESENKFSGITGSKIKTLFKEYSLQKEALKKLNQKKPHLIAGGIQELTAMNDVDALPKISALLKHSSPLVYQEAQYAMVGFKGFEGLLFLDNVTTKISEWQQLRLLLSIHNIPENFEETIKGWLTSKNDSVIIFTLRLLKKFQVLSFYPFIAELLDHSSVEIRIQVVQTLQSMENSSTIAYLIDVYPNQPVEVQLEILRVIKISKDMRCVDFLKQQLLENPLPKIKIYAAEALFSLGFQEYLLQLAKDPLSSEQLIQIIKHALQEEIC